MSVRSSTRRIVYLLCIGTGRYIEETPAGLGDSKKLRENIAYTRI